MKEMGFPALGRGWLYCNRDLSAWVPLRYTGSGWRSFLLIVGMGQDAASNLHPVCIQVMAARQKKVKMQPYGRLITQDQVV